MSSISIWPTDKTLSGVTTPGQSRPGSNGNEEILHIPQSFWTLPLPSDCLVSHPGHSLRGWSHPSTEMQMYFITPEDWTNWKYSYDYKHLELNQISALSNT